MERLAGAYSHTAVPTAVTPARCSQEPAGEATLGHSLPQTGSSQQHCVILTSPQSSCHSLSKKEISQVSRGLGLGIYYSALEKKKKFLLQAQ